MHLKCGVSCGLVKTMVFPVVIYGCESWTVKKAECRRIDAFEVWCWRRLLRVPWTARRSNQSILKDISSGFSFSSVQFSCSAVSDSLHHMNLSIPGLSVHHQLPEFTQTHVHRVGDAPAISSSVIPFSSCPQSLPAPGSFPMSQLFTEFQLQRWSFQ